MYIFYFPVDFLQLSHKIKIANLQEVEFWLKFLPTCKIFSLGTCIKGHKVTVKSSEMPISCKRVLTAIDKVKETNTQAKPNWKLDQMPVEFQFYTCRMCSTVFNSVHFQTVRSKDPLRHILFKQLEYTYRFLKGSMKIFFLNHMTPSP